MHFVGGGGQKGPDVDTECIERAGTPPRRDEAQHPVVDTGKAPPQSSRRSEPPITNNKGVQLRDSRSVGCGSRGGERDESGTRIEHREKNYQLEAEAMKMSVTSLSTISGISVPSASVSSSEES